MDYWFIRLPSLSARPKRSSVNQEVNKKVSIKFTADVLTRAINRGGWNTFSHGDDWVRRRSVCCFDGWVSAVEAISLVREHRMSLEPKMPGNTHITQPAQVMHFNKS